MALLPPLLSMIAKWANEGGTSRRRRGAHPRKRGRAAGRPPPVPSADRAPDQTRIGISTYSASGFALSVTMVGAEPSAKRNST